MVDAIYKALYVKKIIKILYSVYLRAGLKELCKYQRNYYDHTRKGKTRRQLYGHI